MEAGDAPSADLGVGTTCSGTDRCHVGGTPGLACSSASRPAICGDGHWQCPAGLALTTDCACFNLQPGGPCGADAGDVMVARDVPCTGCVPTITWANFGWYGEYYDTATITPCRTFAYTRTRFGGSPTVLCSNELPACGVQGGVGDLETALGDLDVVTALALAPISFGRRPTRNLGSNSVTIGGRTIVIYDGGECYAGEADCNPIPAGVERLIAALQRLLDQQLGSGRCETILHDAG